ncbi:MAG: glycyl-radical enzyme activating protein [Bacteroidales bacterium]|nr:glycyl-radical enzyme activating protein [Bacteroidales bacterium]
MTSGTVFSIEEFAVHDGPGIRTAVFLKGCPLRCTWCHNPEGQKFGSELMVKKGEQSICGTEYTPEDLVAKLLRNEAIFKMNSGGVTFTGGEPLAQAGFLVRVLELLEGRIHTAIETSGFAPEETFREVLGHLDLVMMDVKLVDQERHRQWTGVSNALILRNLETLIGSGKHFIIRIPLIPGVNDDKANLEATAALLEGAQGLQRVEFLPYHKTAGAKYPMVGREYAPGFDTEVPPRLDVEQFEKRNIKTMIL